MNEQKPYTLREAALVLNVSILTMRRYVLAGNVPAFKVGFGKRRDWRIDRQHIDAITERRHDRP